MVGTVLGAMAVGALVTAGFAAAGVVIASAQTNACLPAPALLLSEVAQVAGVNSQLWADLQSVEQADDTSGTAGTSQVVPDMLTVVTRDGYQWDCSSNLLVVASPTIALESTTTTTSGAADSTDSTGVASNTPKVPLTGAPADLASGGTFALAATNSGAGSADQLPVLLLGALALASAGMVVVVIRRYVTRR